jgi:threonine aldolase
MRQAGIIAAAGIFSLDNMLDQIREDHKNAKRLAKGIDQIEGLSIDCENIKTNILYFDIEKGTSRCDKLIRQTQNIDVYPFEINLDGVRFFESRPNHFRLVTHNGIIGDDIERTLLVLRHMLK